MHTDSSRLSPVILETVHLSRAVGGHLLVDDVSIQVRAGEVLAIVGPSGAGKSSFLRLLNRLDEPTGGTVLLEGQDYRSLPPQDLRGLVLNCMGCREAQACEGWLAESAGGADVAPGYCRNKERLQALSVL